MKNRLSQAISATRRSFDAAANDLSRDAREIQEKIVVPAVQLGRNRLVSAFMGGKTGFVVGGLLGGPVGMVKGAAVGAFIGAAAGPAAMERVEKWVTPTPKSTPTPPSNQNDPAP